MEPEKNTKKDEQIIHQRGIKLTRDEGYGFMDLNEMPLGNYSSDNIKYDDISWATTGEYVDMAKNHCGAVLVTNLALFFASNGFSDVIIDDSKDKTFEAVHKIVGNGPIINVAKKAKQYFYERGYSLEHKNLEGFEDIKDAIANNHPLGVLLSSGFFSWHWIMVIGWTQHNSEEKFIENYLRIIDSFYDTADRYYQINFGSRWWSTREYWIRPL